jgi:hypothetical protein
MSAASLSVEVGRLPDVGAVDYRRSSIPTGAAEETISFSHPFAIG